jgi:hypothetical protein
VSAPADVLVVFYTEQETMALLDVMGDPSWSVQAQWCSYGHNSAKYKRLTQNPNANDTLKSGAFGRLSALKIGNKRVILHKSDLHPKQDGTGLAFVGVMQQLIGELGSKYVITTGTAGGIGGKIRCGDVTICTSAVLHCEKKYPKFTDIATLSSPKRGSDKQPDVQAQICPVRRDPPNQDVASRA